MARTASSFCHSQGGASTVKCHWNTSEFKVKTIGFIYLFRILNLKNNIYMCIFLESQGFMMIYVRFSVLVWLFVYFFSSCRYVIFYSPKYEFFCVYLSINFWRPLLYVMQELVVGFIKIGNKRQDMTSWSRSQQQAVNHPSPPPPSPPGSVSESVCTLRLH